jgi:citrate lyase subunit beta/citryl-CoA lyase
LKPRHEEQRVTDGRHDVMDGDPFPPLSLLFVPASRARQWLPKLRHAQTPDAVVIDMEDAVPQSQKARSRDAIADMLQSAFPVPLFVRVNAPATAWFLEDVQRIRNAPALRGIVLPKTESADDVKRAAALVGSASVKILPMLETPLGICQADAIAAADEKVLGLGFGAEDLAFTAGMKRSASGREILYARSRVVFAARSMRRWAIDTPCLLMRPASVRREAAIACGLGFTGKFAVHPAQLDPIREGFTPTDDEVRAARRVVDAFAGAVGSRGATLIDGKVVDRPVALRAEAVLRRAMDRGSGSLKRDS